MKPLFLFLFFFVSILHLIASDSTKIYIHNTFIAHNIYIYTYKVRESSDFIAQIRTDKLVSTATIPLLSFDSNRRINFWIYVKNKYFFGGRWINISTVKEENKVLVVFYDQRRKRRFCYDYFWYEGSSFTFTPK